jgi:uncharacterized protein (DUF1015 family)
MAILRPFQRITAPKGNCSEDWLQGPTMCSTPQEARDEAEGNPYSFLRVVKPEIEMPEDTQLLFRCRYTPKLWRISTTSRQKGWLFQDATPPLLCLCTSLEREDSVWNSGLRRRKGLS